MREIFEKICRHYAGEQGFSGVCLMKTERDTLFSGAYGYANRPFLVPNRIDTRFDTASITKTFTAASILRLAEKGLLSLDDRIVDIIDLSGTKIPGDVRIGHLLNHTSGIADDADEESGESYAALFRDTPNYSFRECGDFLRNFAYKDPLFPAGTKCRYNNCAFILLGLAIEKLTGLSYRAYVEKNIFEPCGMADSGFFAMDEVHGNTAEGYVNVFDENGAFAGWKKNIYMYPPIGTPDGGAYVTAEDLDRFIRAIAANKILTPEGSAALLSPHCAFTKPCRWNAAPQARFRNGYAFEFLEIGEEVFCISKDGQNYGVSAIFAYYPKPGITLTILSNQDCNIWAMQREMQTEIYKRYWLES